jgi:putative ABC transport system substrate-binding protein
MKEWVYCVRLQHQREMAGTSAPSIKRIGVLRDSTLTLGTAQFAAIQAMAPTVGVEVTPIGVQDAGEIEHGIGALARMLNAGLVVTPTPLNVVHRHLIIALAAQHKLPAIYYARYPVKDGGLGRVERKNSAFTWVVDV